ncbi:hypothetical protein OPV22_020917 [Ensete ventricosum]|uniref:Uncharacterized protein n=1 Tax=Ensete ventricosum TaxID=4639 RepID=A0AAV8QP56_ENSVE|nr:hypothetical protein OPV22_020917 [Ensete ventricosum]
MASARPVKLAKESELRMEDGPDEPLRVRLLSGTAEIFSTHLALHSPHAARSQCSPGMAPLNSMGSVKSSMWRTRRLRPRVIVAGPTDSGKSSLCRMLLSWAFKQGWKPTYVDLDVGQGSITIGCIVAAPVEMPIDAIGRNSFGNAYCIFQWTQLRLQIGIFKNLKFLLHATDTFNCDVVLVLGQLSFLEKLCSMLKDVLKCKPTVDAKSLRIREYFDWHATDPTRIVAVSINRDLFHLVLAVLSAKEPNQIISRNVAGYIYVTDIDIQRRKITYLRR